MNFALAVAGTYGHILLGKRSRMDFIGAVACIIFGAAVFIWQSGKISRYKAKRRHMKKRITAVITKRERIEIYVRSSKPVYRYLYTFTGLGETVSLLINANNPKEFWFEKADDPWKMAIALWELWALLLFLYILAVSFVVISAWNSLPMF